MAEILPAVLGLVDDLELFYVKTARGEINFGTNAAAFVDDTFGPGCQSWHNGIWNGIQLHAEKNDTAEAIQLAELFAEKLVLALQSRIPSSRYVQSYAFEF